MTVSRQARPLSEDQLSHRLIQRAIGRVVAQDFLDVGLGLFERNGLDELIEVMVGEALPPFVPIPRPAVVGGQGIHKVSIGPIAHAGKVTSAQAQ